MHVSFLPPPARLLPQKIPDPCLAIYSGSADGTDAAFFDWVTANCDEDVGKRAHDRR
jgi:hypothetical protein